MLIVKSGCKHAKWLGVNRYVVRQDRDQFRNCKFGNCAALIFGVSKLQDRLEGCCTHTLSIFPVCNLQHV